MSQQIYINLPVKKLETTKAFWSGLGFAFDDQFSDEQAACLVISDSIRVMLLAEARFTEFTKKAVADASTTTEVILSLGADSRARVDELADAALAHGGSPASDAQDHGFMYGRSFQDPDNHHWEVMWMDPAAAETSG
ncbi:VOC family protein [Streptomyces sp. HC44]|uniref:VOC family protein n=1 Tax=Streptomyces scabichelini TaxID=2711217 RepID=A0A6G4VG60_9ACTN|nr:VOC family protein [Streptomyces scabichelini]NGO13089.1 VOC family protein [Streptomyces scabichelini]